MENKQTAVEWLVEKLNQCEPWYSGLNDSTYKHINSLIELAKAMERDQIEQAHEDAFISMNMAFRAAHRAEAYYDETYSGDK
jgi:hypothetical protein